MGIIVFAIVDLVLLLATAAFGIASLRKWARHRTADFPTRKIVTHLALQVLAICTWVAFIASQQVAIAWIAFALLTIGQVFGDLLMFASHRARYPDRAKSSYLAMGGDVLSFKRPAAGAHALVGALAWFGMLAICIVTTVTA